MQHERGLRVVLAGILFAALFLPSDPEVESNWALILWYSLEAPICIPFLWALPSLVVLNICLAICLHRGLRTLYRAYLLILFPLVLCATLIMEPFRGIGFWAHPVMVSIAALVEVVLIVRQRRLEQKNAS